MNNSMARTLMAGVGLVAAAAFGAAPAVASVGDTNTTAATQAPGHWPDEPGPGEVPHVHLPGGGIYYPHGHPGGHQPPYNPWGPENPHADLNH
ncbi:hypothetical protein SAMN06264365_109300 [Actinoplanes regularis]|uniref:Secreted protein n=1 Tax=Actinoplanes regularis TaxID=52697 RepID=A0A239BLK5_9ACTN|nr:hypothetical protein Are01nite_45710 [Actinoplanes regularis]GLW30676.1 hypothetical protein Areg01_36160 [Actinoplanes regularis]SNS08512.1 hypothetical protein SAMN06264365_109300 [Actinoplanes regularis]